MNKIQQNYIEAKAALDSYHGHDERTYEKLVEALDDAEAELIQWAINIVSDEPRIGGMSRPMQRLFEQVNFIEVRLCLADMALSLAV